MALSRDVVALKGLSVLILGNSIAARVAGAWLGDSGAVVVRHGPTASHVRPDSPEGRFERQVAHNVLPADFARDQPYQAIIGSTKSLALLSEVPPRLMDRATMIEIASPIEESDRFSETLVADMKLWARSGLGYLTRNLGAEGQPADPCVPCNRQPSILAGMLAATGAVAMSMGEHASTHLRIDQLELLALMAMQPLAFAQMDKRVIGAPQRSPFRMPGGTVDTADGLAYVMPVEPAHWAKLLTLVGGLEDIVAQVIDRPAVLREEVELIDTALRRWARDKTSDDISDLCQKEHIPAAPVCRPDEVVIDKHLTKRDFFASRRVNLPWLAEFGAQGAAREPDDVQLRKGGDLPLSGLRILDLSWAWAGPFATTLLSDLGAEVINVEWHPRLSSLRRQPPFANKQAESHNTAGWFSANQRGKLSIGINLKSAEGRHIIEQLAATCDVVVENFSPGTVDRLGVGYENLVRFNPRLVYVSLSAFGQTGPRSHYIGYGTQVYAASGAGYATSQDGDTCSQMLIPYPDPVSGLGGAFAIAAFVYQARSAGRPARVDLSELEATAAVTLEPLLTALARLRDTGDGQEQFESRIDLQPDCEYQGRSRKLAGEDRAVPQHRFAELRKGEYELVFDGLGTKERVADSGHVLADPYLQRFWCRDQSPEVADTRTLIGGSLWTLNGDRTAIWRGAPPLFGDTRRVLTRLLDLDEQRIDELVEKGAVAG